MKKKMKYYVVSDIHGHCTILKDTLKEAGFFDDEEPHKLIICGDLFDRGIETLELQQFIVELLEKDEVILIKGNHDDMLFNVNTNLNHGMCLSMLEHRNGTDITVSTLTGMSLELIRQEPKAAYERLNKTDFIQKIYPKMIDYFETEKFIFVHGWIPCNVMRSSFFNDRYSYYSDWRNASEREWKNARWTDGIEAAYYGIIEEGKTIVCGHRSTAYAHAYYEAKGSEYGEDADFSPYFNKGIIGIDGCTILSGGMNCMIIEDYDLKINQ